jgi:hypothetical protein
VRSRVTVLRGRRRTVRLSVLQIVPRADLFVRPCGRSGDQRISSSCGPRFLGLSLEIDVLEHGPEEAGEFSGDGHDGDAGSATLFDPAKELVESVLSFPTVGHHVSRNPLLTGSEAGTHAGWMAITPGGLNENVSAMGVAGLGDGSPGLATAGGVFAGDESDVGLFL